jgi:hypothetical protein
MRLTSGAISQNDLTIVESVFNAWCSDRHIARKDAKDEKRVLLTKYLSGKHSQLDLLDALVEYSERSGR